MESSQEERTKDSIRSYGVQHTPCDIFEVPIFSTPSSNGNDNTFAMYSIYVY